MRRFAHRVVELIRLIPFNPMVTLWDDDKKRKPAEEMGGEEQGSKVADRDAIVRVALDYFEGWFDGDAARMERTLHPDLAKRSPDDAPTPGELEKLTAREMIEATAKGIGKTRDVPDRGLEVEVEHVHREIANVTVRSAVYVEYLHLVRTREGWKIVNALWQHP